MSCLSIRGYFPFRRVKITGHSLSAEDRLAMIKMEPDQRYTPICHECGGPARRVHSRSLRVIRDLSMARVVVRLACEFRKLYCVQCERIVVEDLEFCKPFQRVTLRLATYIHELCRMLTVTEVADHLGLDWKTVKNIDKAFLEKEHGQTDYEGLRILAVDEIAVRKGHRYMTVVLDYETGRVVWMGKDRTANTLKSFFSGMTEEQIQGLEAIAMDMWTPYIRAVREAAPHLKIVFDLFHVAAAFSRVIDKVRMSEYSNASRKDRNVFKGAKYLLLKNTFKLGRGEKAHLARLLRLNHNLFILLILRDKLKEIWNYRQRGQAEKALLAWCSVARLVGHPEVDRFIRRLEKYSDGILNHCDYPINTSKLEGVNNKIKVIKRKAYGYHDDRYFTLKVKQAFDYPEAN